jgi:hypothetical protein
MGRGKGKPRDGVKAEQARVNRSMDNASLDTRTTVRRVTTLGTLSTNASGFVAAKQYQSSGVTGTNAWGGLAGRFLEYRVKAIRIRILPLANMNYANGTVVPPVGLFAADMKAGVGYANAAARADGANLRLYRGYGVMDLTCDWQGYPDAHLWTPTTTAIAAAETYGVEIGDMGIAPASAASTVYFRVLEEYEVEFRLPA